MAHAVLLAGVCMALLGGGILQPAQGCTDKDDTLTLHNMYRMANGADGLTWSKPAEKRAREWAQKLADDKCQLEHSPLEWRDGRGENLYAIYGSTDRSCCAAVAGWYDEERHFKYGNGKKMWTSNSARFGDWGHFAQCVWKGSYEVGCAAVAGDNCVVIACHYQDCGNVATDDSFADAIGKPTAASIEDATAFGKKNKVDPAWMKELPSVNQGRKLLESSGSRLPPVPPGITHKKIEPVWVTPEQLHPYLAAAHRDQPVSGSEEEQ